MGWMDYPNRRELVVRRVGRASTRRGNGTTSAHWGGFGGPKEARPAPLVAVGEMPRVVIRTRGRREVTIPSNARERVGDIVCTPVSTQLGQIA